MSRLRLGIDVGGTNTDAVLVDANGTLLALTKVATTPDPMEGIRAAIGQVLQEGGAGVVRQVMLGTTHAANAIIERRGLERVGILRLAAPSSLAVRPGTGWPPDLAAAMLGPTAIVGGGYEHDGSEIAPLDEDAVRRFADGCAGTVRAVAVSCAFSPARAEQELRAGEILASKLGPAVSLTLSHQIGSLGLLEREGAAALNAALSGVSRAVVEGLARALAEHDLEVDTYLTQNDGTLMTASRALELPVLTLGSGPTNSMRGASALAGLSDALVIDVGGTSADVGILVDGFPRESTLAVEVGGVRTNFRMPDLISVGLGGGTVLRGTGEEVRVGPGSVGYRVVSEALVAGGETPTLTDASVRAGRLRGFGDARLAMRLPQGTAEAALAWVDEQVRVMCDRMKASRGALPLIAVGGGSHLVADRVEGVSEVLRPTHFEVANAYGAAIAEASGEVDRVYRYGESSRAECLEDARRLAVAAAARAGADPTRTRVTTLVEVPMAYVPGGGCRVQVKAAGPLATLATLS